MRRDRVLLLQGGYYVVTGVAPFVSRGLFEAVTGRKREWWLVQTVGGLVTAIGGGLLAGVARARVTPELVGVAAGAAGTLAAIDVAYVARRRISPTYLVDASIQVALLGGLSFGQEAAPRRQAPGAVTPAMREDRASV
jgi:hypothetical protein